MVKPNVLKEFLAQAQVVVVVEVKVVVVIAVMDVLATVK
jgi:hypothetical protein